MVFFSFRSFVRFCFSRGEIRRKVGFWFCGGELGEFEVFLKLFLFMEVIMFRVVRFSK